MKLFPRICALVLIVLGTTAVCHAQTAYVSDMLILSFRQGPGTGYPVISALKSDTPLTIIEERNGYLKVELTSGEQGWVDKKYVVPDPPKSIIIEQLKKQKAALEEKVNTLTQQAAQTPSGTAGTDTAQMPESAAVQKLQKENQALSQKLETLESQHAALKAASTDATDTLEENKRLKTDNATLQAKLARQKKNDKFIFKPDMIKWALAGVGILLLGWVIGLSLSSRKGSSGSLLD